jgi:hypothetical protein
MEEIYHLFCTPILSLVVGIYLMDAVVVMDSADRNVCVAMEMEGRA